MLKSLIPALALTLVAALPSQANVDRPTFIVGGGTAVSPMSEQPTFNVLLRVSVSGISVSAGAFDLVLAKIKGDVVLSPYDGTRALQYLDIEFVPVQLNLGGGLSGAKFQFLPASFGANVPLDQEYKVRVDVLGYEKNYLGPSRISTNSLFYAKIAAEAAGYKVVNHLASENVFHGFSIAAVQAAAGLVFRVGKLKFRIEFGGKADVSLGANSEGGVAIQSDSQVYNELSMDITRYVRIFVRNTLLVHLNTEMEGTTLNDYQILAGATFIW